MRVYSLALDEFTLLVLAQKYMFLSSLDLLKVSRLGYGCTDGSWALFYKSMFSVLSPFLMHLQVEVTGGLFI